MDLPDSINPYGRKLTMNAIMVSVDYADLLAITLEYNRHHFKRVVVVTAPHKPDYAVAKENGAEVYITDSFYKDGATFNKWRALEEAIDATGLRKCGWLCLMDADVLWPKKVKFHSQTGNPDTLYMTYGETQELWMVKGKLYSPLRHMMPNWTHALGTDGQWHSPPEECWSHFPIHRNVNEWAGYTQVFHCDDPVLGTAPWHDTMWLHAGGADSAFQAKWPTSVKVRTPWNCLHLGEAGKNWMGRATPYLDGTLPQESGERLRKVDEIWKVRRDLERRGMRDGKQFEPEKIKRSTQTSEES